MSFLQCDNVSIKMLATHKIDITFFKLSSFYLAIVYCICNDAVGGISMRPNFLKYEFQNYKGIVLVRIRWMALDFDDSIIGNHGKKFQLVIRVEIYSN